MSIFKKKADGRQNNGANFTEEDRNISLERRKHNAELRNTEISLKRMELDLKKQELQIQGQINQTQQLVLLKEMKEQLSPSVEGDSPESMLNEIIKSYVMNKVTPNLQDQAVINQPPQPQPQVITPQPNSSNSMAEVELTEEQIKEFIDNLPKSYVKIAKKLPDNQLMIFIKSNYPTLPEEQSLKVVEVFRSSY